MSTFREEIEAAGSIAIIGHIRPDGDCIGSCLALYNYITDNYPQKTVAVYLQPIVKKFRFLCGADQIKSIPEQKNYDLAVSLDCSDKDRHGEFHDIFLTAGSTMCLDHHRTNQSEGEYRYFYCDPDASSTCEVLWRHLEEDKVSKNCAEALYVGIVHDTGVFKYPSTTKETMCIAGTLISKGVDSQSVIDGTFYRLSFSQNRLCGRAVLDAKLFFDGKVIASCVTKEIFEEYGASKSDTDGIIDRLRITNGVEVAIFSYQLSEDTYKFSLRSVSYVDVSKIAVSFGGGGHIRASGFEAKGSQEENLRRILDMIGEQLSVREVCF